MNKWILHKAQRHKYRKYALRISMVVHVVMFLTIPFVFIKNHIQEMEDAVQVELIELPKRQIVKKQPKPIPKKEPPPPETPAPKVEIEMPELDIEIETPQKRVVEKEVNAIEHNQNIEIEKMPAGSTTAVDIQQASLKQADVNAPALSDAPDLATDAELPTSPDSIVDPIGADAGDSQQSGLTKRSDTGVRSPGKGTGQGVKKGIRETGAGKTTGKQGNGTGGSGTGSGTGSSGDGNATFSSIIGDLTGDIIASSGGNPIDVVFVVDASGSMQDNINAVAAHLGQMVDAYKASEIDYQLGLTHFNADLASQRTQQNNIHVFQLTRDLSTYKQRLYAIRVTGDENALDAIHQTLTQLRFRTNTIKHLILVTDEPFTSIQNHTVETIIQLCQRNELLVHVLGLAIPEHQKIAQATGGSWHEVPQDPLQQRTSTPQPRTADAQQIGNVILADGANIPVDIILFIDGSKSMADKGQYITEQIDLWIRNWDHAIIEYRIGVVRFRASGNINRINVFKPPQTKAQIHDILQLLCQDDENLLYAVGDAIQKLKRRSNAKTHFILITDEPGNPKQHFTGTISLLKELPVTVHVIGAADTFQQQVAAQTGGVFVKIPNAHTQNKRNQ